MTKNIIFLFPGLLLFLQIQHAQDPDMSASLQKHVYTLASDSLLGRGFGYTSKIMAVNYIAGEFESAGLKPINGNYIHPFIHQCNHINIEGFNIAGLIEGSDPVLKTEYIVIGAHFDHLGYKLEGSEKVIYNGADDNASGVATIIEIARKLNREHVNLKRSVIILAFDAEEIGLVGSKQFLSEKIIDTKKIKLMFSLDMVGMYKKNDGVEFNGIYSLQHGFDLLEETREYNPVKVSRIKKDIEMRTDTWSFSAEGIPAVHVHTGQKSPYHKPEDDSNLLDYEGMAKIADFMSDFIHILSNAAELKPDHGILKKSTDPVFSAGLNYKIGRGKFIYRNEFYNAKSMLDFEAGLAAQIKLSKYLIFQPELLYQTSASKSAEGDTRRHSLSPQANILLTTANDKRDKPFGYFSVGGFYNYHFNGFVAGKKMDFGSFYNRHEKGISLGMGTQIYKYQISYVYKLGMTNIYQEEKEGKVLSNCKYFSLVYFF